MIQQLEKAEEDAGPDSFDIDFARKIVADLTKDEDTEDNIIEAYRIMAEDNPKPGMIEQGLLNQKMMRRLQDQKLTDQMIADGQPDADGNIEYAAFVKRQFEFRTKAFTPRPSITTPTVKDTEALLGATKWKGGKPTTKGHVSGPPYASEFKTNAELAKEFGGKAESVETQRLLDIGKQQREAIAEKIKVETDNKIADMICESLKTETNCHKASDLLRKFESLYTGHKWAKELDDVDLACAAEDGGPKINKARKALVAKWKSYEVKE